MSSERPLLHLDDVVRHFGGVNAVDGITLSAHSGEVIGVMGPNGSGKSTLFNLITGIYSPSSGKITLDGVDVTGYPPHVMARHGVARTFQNPRVFGRLTALQHAVVGQVDESADVSVRGLIRHLGRPWTRASDHANRVLERVFRGPAPEGVAAAQPYGTKRLLEVARCLAASPRLLLLDEPTAGLNDAEGERLRDVLSTVAREDGLTMLIIAHNVEFLARLCSRIVVINRGKCISDGKPDNVRNDRVVFEAYFGGAR